MTPHDRGELGQYLWDLRQAAGIKSIRDAEDLSGVSNAYISQIETGKMKKPSPDILSRLADAYRAPYETLMELAGHIRRTIDPRQVTGRLPTFVKEDLTEAEEAALLEYLAFLRIRGGKSAVKKDDQTVSEAQQREINRAADLLLKKASAYGVFPTPIDEIIVAAELEIARENVLDQVFLGQIYRSLPNSIKLIPDRLKKAAEKVWGLIDCRAKTIYLDSNVPKSKRPFLALHEVAHHNLSWQRRTFDLLEDSESQLDEDTRDEFERQANVFASDVLFQRDTFTNQAADSGFGIMVPVKLSKTFGSSVYASMRRYVTTNALPCAALVFEKPDPDQPLTRLTVRRAVASTSFGQMFGRNWMKSHYERGEFFIEHLPYKKFAKPSPLSLRDLNGDLHNCLAEAFDSSRQIFFLIRSLGAATTTKVSF